MAKSWHVPASAPDGITQRPLQHWSLVVHVSLSCLQNEALASHFPLVQSCEQQSRLVVQLSPVALHTPPLIA